MPVFSGVSEETAKGDDGGEARKVDEDVRGDRLHGQRVFEVGQVTRKRRFIVTSHRHMDIGQLASLSSKNVQGDPSPCETALGWVGLHLFYSVPSPIQRPLL